MSKTILLVDDQAEVRQILSRMLGSLGYAVVTACDSADALAVDAARPDAIDILLTDLEMPPGMDGRQLARLLRERHPGLGVLFLSGQLDDGDDTGASVDEAGRYLMKPCTMKELSASLSRLIEHLPRD